MDVRRVKRARSSAPKSLSKKKSISRKAYGPIDQQIDRLEDPYADVILGGFEEKKLVHLRYFDYFSLNATSIGLNSYTFSANGMYDPNVTSTGHQPNGFDQLMSLYNHYTVIDSTCRLQPVQTVGSNQTPGMYDLLLSNQAALVGTTIYDLMETREGTGMRYQYGTERNYFGQPKNLTRKFNAKKFFSLPDVVGDANYRGSVISNPQEQAYFHVVVCGPNEVADPAVYTFSVQLDFLAIMTEPVAFTSS